MSWVNLPSVSAKQSFSYLMNWELSQVQRVCKNWKSDSNIICHLRKEAVKKIKELFAMKPTSFPFRRNDTLQSLIGGGLLMGTSRWNFCLNENGEEVQNHPFDPRSCKYLCEFQDVQYLAIKTKLVSYDKRTQEQSTVADLELLNLASDGKIGFQECYALSKDKLIFQCTNNGITMVVYDVFTMVTSIQVFGNHTYVRKVGDFFYFFDSKEGRFSVTRFDNDLTPIQEGFLEGEPVIKPDTLVVKDLAFIYDENHIHVYSPDQDGNLKLLWKRDLKGLNNVKVSYPFISYIIDNNLYIVNAKTGVNIFISNIDTRTSEVFKDNIIAFKRHNSVVAFLINTFGCYRLNMQHRTGSDISDFVLNNDKLFMLRTNGFNGASILDIRPALQQNESADSGGCCTIL